MKADNHSQISHEDVRLMVQAAKSKNIDRLPITEHISGFKGPSP
jgi:hypothetical protein